MLIYNFFLQVENAVRQGKTGIACTDVQRKWNTGTRKNVGQRKIKQISFSHHKPNLIYASPIIPAPYQIIAPQLFCSHDEFKQSVDSSVMAPLFQLQTNGLLQLCYRTSGDCSKAGIDQSNTGLPLELQMPHSEHGTELNCQKCKVFYETYVKISPDKVNMLAQETVMQSASQVWHDARKLRVTASTAKKIPKHSATNPRTFLNEHLFPTFKGNTATKYGQDNEDNAIKLVEERGFVVQRKGLVVNPHQPWLAASPDGILDSMELLEVKCPQKGITSLAEFLSQPNADIQSLGDGHFNILPNGKNGYYLQVQLTMMCLGLLSCKLVIWTPTENLMLDIPFDLAYTQTHVRCLQNFYFLHMLPRLVDDFVAGKLKVCNKYLELVQM